MAVFSELVWNLAKRIPEGKVSTYGEVARALGKPGAGRAVGQALKRNPHAPIVPCHRVVRSTGELGGYSGSADDPARIRRKKALLRSEGLRWDGNRIDLAKYGHRF